MAESTKVSGSSIDTANKYVAPPVPIDPELEKAQLRERLANLERLATADAAQKVPGHRPAAEIRADLDIARGKLTTMVRDKDSHQEKKTREDKLRKAKRAREEALCVSVNVPFDEVEWLETVGPAYAIPAALLADLHKQHYIVAKFERELEALAEAMGPQAFA